MRLRRVLGRPRNGEHRLDIAAADDRGQARDHLGRVLAGAAVGEDRRGAAQGRAPAGEAAHARVEDDGRLLAAVMIETGVAVGLLPGGGVAIEAGESARRDVGVARILQRFGDGAAAVLAPRARQLLGGAVVASDSPLLARGDAIGCAVRRTGEVACWSMGEAFELRARPIAGLRDVVALSDGGWHACARLRDGTVRCWGKNACGQLGDGTVVARPLPGVAVPVRDVDELSAGFCHTCARTRAGEMWCWGRHEARTAPPRWREEFTPVVGLPAP
ncbi:RCC1 domain-containing protein [Nannocystis radixulma]|uniref:Regulator of chromosome condensation (RCC1) repeat-containing protein n=1 Tax=Nannocystis radixulma TaxID=2995305 RepID=A0ABT5BMW3_9BACT|nr:hypothetical protein [Nannocystis radixulma]MDC0675499.1 hypothetical protein [Nannocystis radixulma]